jgi:hypothetical protein
LIDARIKGGIGGTLVLLKKKLDLVINENSLNQKNLKGNKGTKFMRVMTNAMIM